MTETLKPKIEFRSDPRPWIVAILLTLLIHLALKWVYVPHVVPEDRVTVQTVDPTKLEAVRKQWSQREKALLLDKGQPEALTPPENAKAYSNRNIRVEKETRAEKTAPVPGKKMGDRGTSLEKAQPVTAPRLGVPIDLTAPRSDPKPRTSPSAAGQRQIVREGEGEQLILDPSLPTGAETLLNAQESVFYSFYSRIYDKIAPTWQSIALDTFRRVRAPQGDYYIRAEVVYDAQGNLIDVEISQFSGIQAFDETVIRAWHQIGRIPYPPKDLIDKNGQVRMGWSFHIPVSPLVRQIMPPKRDY